MGVKLPKYRRHPNGQAFIEYRTKRTYLGVYDSQASREMYAEFVKQIAAGSPLAMPIKIGKDPTVSELLDAYLKHAETYYSRDGKPTKEMQGVDAAMKLLHNFCRSQPGGSLDGAEFGPAKLIEFQEFLVNLRYLDWRPKSPEDKDRRTPQRYARTYINKVVSKVKRFFRWCCQRELLPSEQYHKLLCVQCVEFGRSTAPESEEIIPVPRSVVELTLPYLNPTVAAMVQTQMLCGMRPAEVCIMRGVDIDRSGPIWLYVVSEHKNAWRKHVLTKAVPRVAQKLILPYWRSDLSAFLFSPKDSIAEKNGKFTARKKRPIRDRYDTCSYRRAIVYGIEKAARAGVEIPHWHPNQLRHTIATEIRQLVSEQAAQLWLGHAHMQTTGIYAQKQVSELLVVAEELDRRWAS
jgi:integrase